MGGPQTERAKSIVITGASSGIGRPTALGLARAGGLVFAAFGQPVG